MVHVLIIEDDPGIRTALTRALQARGHAVDSAPDGLGGLQSLLTQEPEAVILDLGLPDVSGERLLGMIRANRPWRLAVGLTRALSAAAATGVATLVTSDLWLLSATLGPLRLLALALLSVGAVSATLVVGAGLWERTRHGRGREQVMLFNMATTATVVIGVLVFYLALFVVSLVAALLLVDAGLFGEVIGRPAGMVEFGRLAWFTATLAAVGGAVGAGLETDDAVRHAAYTRDGAEAPSSD